MADVKKTRVRQFSSVEGTEGGSTESLNATLSEVQQQMIDLQVGLAVEVSLSNGALSFSRSGARWGLYWLRPNVELLEVTLGISATAVEILKAPKSIRIEAGKALPALINRLRDAAAKQQADLDEAVASAMSVRDLLRGGLK